MEERIIKAPEDAALPEPINFQSDRNRTLAPAGRRHFSDGERNNGLRDVMCRRWIHGFATDRPGLFGRCAKSEPRDARMVTTVAHGARHAAGCPGGESRGQGLRRQKVHAGQAFRRNRPEYD